MSSSALKVWITIGAIATLALLIMPPIILQAASKDVQRYRECIAGTRVDCQRTIVWNLVDAALLVQQQSGGSLDGTMYAGLSPTSDSGAVRTSENAPFISGVEPAGMSNNNGTYSAKAGDEIVFRATLSGMIVSADLYAVEVVDGVIERPQKIETFHRVDGDLWEARYALTPGFTGSVEVRVYGEDPKDLAVLALPVAAK
jgi:hypothetical protein